MTQRQPDSDARGDTTVSRAAGADVALRYSVIVCARNESRYLPACLHSLLAQTRPPDEVLVIDNASTDNTREVAERIPTVRVVHEPRKGR